MAESSLTISATYYGHVLVESRYDGRAVIPWLLSELTKLNPGEHVQLQLRENNVFVSAKSGSKTEEKFKHEINFLVPIGNRPQSLHGIFTYLRRTGPLNLRPELHAYRLENEMEVRNLVKYINEMKVRQPKPMLDNFRREGQIADPINVLMKRGHSIFEVQFVFRLVLKSRSMENVRLDRLLASFYHPKSSSRTPGHPPTTRARTTSVGAAECDASMPSVERPRRLSGDSASINSSGSSVDYTDGHSLCISSGIGNSAENVISQGDSRPSRTMLLDIGPTSVALISTLKKTVLFEKFYTEVPHACKSAVWPDHFALVFSDSSTPNANEDGESTFTKYVFRCASEDLAKEIYQNIVQSFMSHFHSIKLCDTCPLQTINLLASDINEISHTTHDTPDKYHRQIEQTLRVRVLRCQKDDVVVMEKLIQEETRSSNLEEKNIFVFSQLRQLMERKQQEHRVHQDKADAKDSKSNVEDLLSRAKKSFAGSFIFKSFGSKKEADQQAGRSRSQTSPETPGDHSPLHSPANEEKERKEVDPTTLLIRSRSVTVSPTQTPPALQTRISISGLTLAPQDLSTVRRSSEMPRKLESALSQTRRRAKSGGPMDLATGLPSDVLYSGSRRESMRVKIFRSVVSPRRSAAFLARQDDIETISENEEGPALDATQVRSSEELRLLWQRAIEEVMELVRMMRRRRKVQADPLQGGVSGVDLFDLSGHLSFCDLSPSIRAQNKQHWTTLLAAPDHPWPRSEVHDVLRQGVSPQKRGEVWRFLVRQRRVHGRDAAAPELPSVVGSSKEYHEILHRLTTYQHAILIDVGRTFPQHAYFSNGGSGQIALFNLLKAYSLTDEEVGYCQGLSFVAGVFLLHLSEEDAFNTFSYLMYKVGMRELYKPELSHVQLCMYQLSRLLHDHCPEVHAHLEAMDIAPSLYAAPWFLAVFSTHFPIGFVVRVFDLLFDRGVEAILRVALLLLQSEREGILACETFEETSDYVKVKLPNIPYENMRSIIDKAFELDLSSDLYVYSIEYRVLYEEVLSNEESAREVVRGMQATNRELARQLQLANRQQEDAQASVVDLSNLKMREKQLVEHTRKLEEEREALIVLVNRLMTMLPRNENTSIDFADIGIESNVSLSHLEPTWFHDNPDNGNLDPVAEGLENGSLVDEDGPETKTT